MDVKMIYGQIGGLSKPVSRLFFGTAMGPMIMGESVEPLLDEAVALGINGFDCARGYGAAENCLGRWMEDRHNREDVVVLTKCGNADAQGHICLNRQVIEKELDESLKALKTDYIDIYLLHRDDPATPVSEYIDTLNQMKKAGKIKIFGASNWTHTRIAQANAYAKEQGLEGFSMSSPNFGLARQVHDPWQSGCVTITGEENAQARQWYRENQMPVLAYSSLARGLMAGKIKSSDEPRAKELLDPFAVRGYVSNDNFQRLKRCEILSEKKECTVSQLAIAWMFKQGLNLYGAFTSANPRRIRENIKALSVPLTQEEAAYLNLEA